MPGAGCKLLHINAKNDLSASVWLIHWHIHFISCAGIYSTIAFLSKNKNWCVSFSPLYMFEKQIKKKNTFIHFRKEKAHPHTHCFLTSSPPRAANISPSASSPSSFRSISPPATRCSSWKAWFNYSVMSWEAEKMVWCSLYLSELRTHRGQGIHNDLLMSLKDAVGRTGRSH